MCVEKKPCDKKNYYYDIKCFSSAREAFRKILSVCGKKGEYTLFLPAYIGWSPKEGSGIYDPVHELKISHVFYSLTGELVIDMELLKTQLKAVKGRKVFLFVHYFGYVDPHYKEILSLLKEEEVFVIEDGAHGLYTHMVDKQCGYGDCILYSFHKMLPFHNGGGICTQNTTDEWWNDIEAEKEDYFFYKYDLVGIAQKRKENAVCWEELLKQDKRLTILRKSIEYERQTPQTFPVLLNFADRYQVYLEMNRLNYGVISLYHTMIEPIKKINNTGIQEVSDKILNLPVHQDIGKEEIYRMYDVLVNLLE